MHERRLRGEARGRRRTIKPLLNLFLDLSLLPDGQEFVLDK
jgi:hypothetical protein